MLILHVTLGLPPYRTGGLTKYSVDLMTEQVKQGNQVALLYPGNFIIPYDTEIKHNKNFENIKVFEIINPLPVPLLNGIKNPNQFMKKGNKDVYLSFFRKMKPDIIHMHTLMGIHKEFLEAAKDIGIKLVFTSHDYFGICPKVNLIDSEGKICKEYQDGEGCIACNEIGLSLPVIMLMQSSPYRFLKDSIIVKKIRQYKKGTIELVEKPNNKKEITSNTPATDYVKLREFYIEMFELIDEFHFNSSIAKDVYQKYIGDNKGKVISISHSSIKDNRSKKEYPSNRPLQLAYLGPLDNYKGFNFMLSALEILREDNCLNWHLNLYGDSRELKSLDPEFYTFNGRYKYNELENIFKNTDLLIVPSMWKETFGFIGLEALSYGIPTLVSDNVGYKDIIEDGKTGIVFRSDSDKDFIKKIKSLVNKRETLMTIQENILKMNFSNTMTNHTREILSFYNQVKIGVEN